MAFWEEVEIFRACKDKNQSAHLAQKITKVYIASGTQSQINLTEKERTAVEAAAAQDEIPSTIFDEAVTKILGLIKGNSFWQFCETPEYQEWVLQRDEEQKKQSQACCRLPCSIL